MLNRREFIGLCVLSSSLPAVSTMFAGLPGAFAAANAVDANAGGRAVEFPDGTLVPALGQGSWHLGQGRHPAAVEEEALRTGLSLGMTLIDTAEGYSNGRSEELIGRVIAGQRDRVFLVSKERRAKRYAKSIEFTPVQQPRIFTIHYAIPSAAPILLCREDGSAGSSTRRLRSSTVSRSRLKKMEDSYRWRQSSGSPR